MKLLVISIFFIHSKWLCQFPFFQKFHKCFLCPFICKSSATRLLYCTTGVLLRRLEGDTALQGVTHIIVDEVHERTEESDFLLLVLKDIVLQRPTLQVILMSATLNAELFSDYFNSCPVITIPGD